MSGQRDERVVIAATAAATAAAIGIGALAWYRYYAPGPAAHGRAAAAAPPAGGDQRSQVTARGRPSSSTAAGQSETAVPGAFAQAQVLQQQRQQQQQQKRQPVGAPPPQPMPQPAQQAGPALGSQMRLSGAAAAMLSMVAEDDEEGEEEDGQRAQQPNPEQRPQLASASDPAPTLPAQQRIAPPPRPLPRAVAELAKQQSGDVTVHSNSAPATSAAMPAEPPSRQLPPGTANPAALAQASKSLAAIYSSVGTGGSRRKMPAAARAERLAASNQTGAQTPFGSNAPAVTSRPEPSVRVGSLTSDSSLDSSSRRSGGLATTPRWQQQRADPAGQPVPAAPLAGDFAGAMAWPAGGVPVAQQQQQHAQPQYQYQQPQQQRACGVMIPDSSTASSSMTSASADIKSSSSSGPGNSSAGVRRSSMNDASGTMPLGSFTTVLEPANDASLRSASGGGGGGNNLPAELDWELDGANLELCRHDDGSPWQLGQGSFGTVYKALSHGVQPVAVKIFPTHATPQQHAEFQREVVLLKSCRDGNIVQFLGASQTEHQTLMITEYMENGDLFTAFRNDTTGSLLWYRRDSSARDGVAEPGLGRQIALDIARGLHFLHRHNVVHFDLKSPNVLLGRDNVAKIADVGLAKILQKDYVSSLQSCGTFAWSAPEVLLGARCSEKVDIYSLGVILWELVTGESPARGRLRAVRVPEECPLAIADLITRCMDSKPANRPSAKDVVVVLSEQAKVMDRARSKRSGAGALEKTTSKRAPDAECSEDLIAAIVNMCHVVGGPASGITREEAVAAATFKDELRTYKMYVREVQKTLAMPGVETEGSPTHQRLVALVESHRAVMVIFMQEHTNTIRRFQFVSLQEAAAYVAKAEKPGDRGAPAQEITAAQPSLPWSLILESLDLTEQQRKSLAAARNTVVQRLRAITDERKRLMAALHSFVLQTPHSGGFVSAVDHSEGLKANLEEEGALLQDFHIVFTCKTLTALQQARLEVGAFPCLPDAMTVCGLIAKEMAGERIGDVAAADAKALPEKPVAGEAKLVRARSL